VPASKGGVGTLASGGARCEDWREEMSGPLDAFRFGAALGGAAASRARQMASRGALAALDAFAESRFAAEAAERMLTGPVPRALDSAAAERLVARVIQGPLLDEAVSRLLESEDLWLMVDVIAQSPAVTEAIGRQSIGFADQVAGAMRDRSFNADERLEFAARRLLRRSRRAAPAVEPDPSPES
jgi:hypothetical protein